ncbi:transcriptional regulator, TetR family [Paracoccus denitrificans PD1222]|uniref:Transcriptional regulator, TetR family n=2 Tax=Paracoccus denitrificans TaxID=266 RepID=A1B135_PARDP|nr:transcriptional regulator, TetR family [Paracoccus denitrificans PD1222]
MPCIRHQGQPERRPMTQRKLRPRTRIQREKTEQILAAALDVFAASGFAGGSINTIAKAAGVSTPNLLYYFKSKEEIRRELLERTLQLWMAPLSLLNPNGDPIDEICAYISRKLEISKNFPKESKLFAYEMLSGLEESRKQIFEALKVLYYAKIAVIEDWMKSGQINAVSPQHLIFSIWATTQHYSDFDTQIEELWPESSDARYASAEKFLTEMYRRLLTPR